MTLGLRVLALAEAAALHAASLGNDALQHHLALASVYCFRPMSRPRDGIVGRSELQGSSVCCVMLSLFLLTRVLWLCCCRLTNSVVKCTSWSVALPQTAWCPSYARKSADGRYAGFAAFMRRLQTFKVQDRCQCCQVPVLDLRPRRRTNSTPLCEGDAQRTSSV